MEEEERNHIWESYWGGEEDHSWWKRPAPEVLEFIASQSPEERPNVLDLGCGLGRHATAFAQAGFSVTATDSSENAVSHLRKWAEELALPIRVEVCDVLGGNLSKESFDIVLSYNVIYHGYRREFAAAIRHVHSLLKPGGLFYFTCPSRADGKYGSGEQVAPHTFKCEKSVTPGDIHYFADRADLDELLSGFRELSRKKEEGHWNNRGEEQFYSNWHILAEKV
jgi:2-polyprenyl-3-methyl-5-hydroxy-6-metoxy-1,4-benzoquinol methylase